MSIQILRDNLKDIPGSHTLTMGYGRDEDGKEIQVFKFDGKEFRTSCAATADEIRETMTKAL